MKFEFHLLPHNDINKKEEAPLEWKPFYTGSSKFLSFLSRNALYLLSFCIPVFLLFFLMAYYGFAPFGENSLFILNGSEYLSVFASFSEQLHSGRFSLLAQSGQIGSEYYSTIIYFLSSPIHLFLAAFPCGIATQLLSITVVLRIGFAGLFMSLYMTNRLTGRRASKYDLTSLLFSLGYSLSSYMLIQYNEFMFLDCAMLFPLLILTYEFLWKKENSKPFILLLFCMFISNFYITSVIIFFLFLHFLTRKKGDFFAAFRKVGLFLRSAFVSAALSAVTIIPGFYSLYRSALSEYVWPEFITNHDWLSLFSKFMPGNYGSYVTASSLGSNLYCGLFILILLFFYLFDKKIDRMEKIRNFLYLIILFLFANILSLHYVGTLFSQTYFLFNCFGFIICFFVLSIAADSFYQLKESRLFSLFLAILLPFGLFLLATLHAKEYNNKTSLLMSLILFVIYAILLIFYRINSINRKTYLILLMLFCTGELFINANNSLSYIKTDALPLADTIVSASAKQYSKPLNPFTAELENHPELQFCSFIAGEYNQPDKYSATVFDAQNDIAASLGAKQPVFETADLAISYKLSDNITCRKTDSNIFTLKVIPDTPNAKTANNHIYLTITPDKSGELYLYTTKLAYLGYVTAGEPVEYMMTFPTTSNIYENYWVHGAYLQTDVLQQTADSIKCNFDLKDSSGFSSYLLNVDVPENGNLLLNLPYSKWLRVQIDGSAADQLPGPNNTTVIPITKGAHAVKIQLFYGPFYLGLLLSLISLLLYLRFAKKRIPYAVAESKVLKYVYSHMTAVCTFLIPFGILIVTCIYANLAPFGIDTFFKNDGSALTIPTFFQMREQIKNGSLLYARTVGGGSNIFYTLPAMFLNFWLCLIPEESLLSAVTIIEIVKIALCGTSAYLYFTRRKIGLRMHKNDYRILIFTTGYSLCSYMINMRGFFSWVDILLLFPLILLAMDKLMLEKKKAPYIFLLMLGILINYNITLYVCVFLVFTFFTYRFDNFKDFLCKGIRFAFSSILSAGMCFFVLYATYMGMQVSPYSDQDSVFPTFTFYQSFFDSIKQSFMLAEPVVITTADGAINLYCGVLCLLLVVLYILFGKRCRNKYLKLAFMLFIFFSSNNNMLSYVWNGFHYQTKVPNRYSFLLIFLLIDVAIDALYHLKNYKTRKILISAAATEILLLLTCIFTNVPMNSWISTAILIPAFAALLSLCIQKKGDTSRWKKVLTTVVIFELFINTIFAFSFAKFAQNDAIMHNRKVTDFLKAEYLGDSLSDRIAYIGPVTTNQGMVNNVNVINQFNSFLSLDQYNMGALLGYGVSNNLLTAANNVTPFSNAVTNTKYMLVDEYTTTNFHDLEHYKPVAVYDSCTILENERALPISFFIPYETCIYVKDAEEAEFFANNFVLGFVPSGELFTDCTLIKNVERSVADPENNYTFSTNNGLKYQTVRLKPKKSGYYYYRTHEFFNLGYLNAGESYEYTLEVSADENGGLSIYHDDVFQKFYDEASKHTMEITDYGDTYLDGTLTLPKDGCVYFSIPYERGWTAYVDGQKTDLGVFSNGAMFLATTEGTHDIHLEFKPAGITTGVAVSLGFVFLYLLVILSEIITKKRSRTSASPEISTEIE